MIQRVEWLLLSALTIVLSTGIRPAQDPHSADSAASAPRALLVGIGKYAGEDGARPEELRGVENDVTQMYALLTDRFNFPEENVVTLVDEEATLEAIVRSFWEHLIEPSNEDTEVVFYFTGHGARLPDRAGEETDTLDSSFLAYDSRADGNLGERDLVDDLLATLRLQLSERTERLLMITDACHSAGGVRSDDPASRTQSVKSPYPSDALRAFDPASITQFDFWPQDLEVLDDDAQPADDRFVHIAACQAREQAREIKLADGSFHGALTWFLCERLEQVRPGQTWRELMARVGFDVSDVAGHLPDVDGQVDREIFGSNFSAPLGTPCITTVTQTLKLESGGMLGTIQGSEFELLQRKAGELVPVGKARASQVGDVSAVLRWEEGVPQGIEPHTVLYAKLLRVGDESERLRIRMDFQEDPIPTGGFFGIVAPDGDPRYRLVLTQDHVVLETVEGVRVGMLEAAGDAAWHEQLDRLAEQEVRYQRLQRMARQPGPSASIEVRFVEVGADESEVELGKWRPVSLRAQPAPDIAGRWLAVDLPPNDDEVKQVVRLQFRCTSEKPVYFVAVSVPDERPFREDSVDSCFANLIYPLERAHRKAISGNDWIDAVVALSRPEHWPHEHPMRDRFLVLATTQEPDQSVLDNMDCSSTTRGRKRMKPTFEVGVADILIPPR